MKNNHDQKRNKAVVYCRVSTKEQVEEGNSLKTQERICREYALRNGYEVVEVFIEQGESAKTADRTELKKLMTYCSNKRNNIKALIIYKIDRLSRNTDDYSQIRVFFKRHGVEIKSTSERFEDNPVGRFLENTMANIAQFDNDIRTERSVGGMKEAIREGRYVWRAPVGYLNTKVNGKATITQDPVMAPRMRRAFELLATGQYVVEQVRILMINEGLTGRAGRPINQGYFYRMMTNHVYGGVITKFGEVHQGSFVPIVPEFVFKEVQRILSGKRRKRVNYKRDNPDFPLRRFIHNEKGENLTGSWSKGKLSRYPYYRFKGANNSFSKIKIEQQFLDFMDHYRFEEEKIDALRNFIKTHLLDATVNERRDREHNIRLIQSLQAKQSSIIEKNISGLIPDTVLKQQLDAIERQIFEAKQRVEGFQETQVNYRKLTKFILAFLRNPASVWRIAPLEKKIQLQWFQFPKGLIYENGEFRTPKLCYFYKENWQNFAKNSPKVTLENGFANNPEVPNVLQNIVSDITSLSQILNSIKEYPAGLV